MRHGQLIRSALRDGPTTASELAVILGLPMRICSAWLGNLRCRGEVEVVGQIRNGRHLSNLYALHKNKRGASMKALSLTQPWATLIAIGAKRIETRGWATGYRGPLAIHAAKGFPRWAKEACAEDLFHAALKGAGYDIGLRSWDILPRGCVLATCRLVSCFSTDGIKTGTSLGVIADCGTRVTEQEYAFGDYRPGRYAWLLADVNPLPVPIPAQGALGLWEWDSEAPIWEVWQDRTLVCSGLTESEARNKIENEERHGIKMRAFRKPVSWAIRIMTGRAAGGES